LISASATWRNAELNQSITQNVELSGVWILSFGVKIYDMSMSMDADEVSCLIIWDYVQVDSDGSLPLALFSSGFEERRSTREIFLEQSFPCKVSERGELVI
jgi:hypothetical protein